MRCALPLLLVVLADAAAARRPADTQPTGEIVLDRDAPIVEAVIAGVPLRLTVSLDGRDTVELNPQAAARLPLVFEDAGELEVGRVTLHGRQARAEGKIAGRPVTLVVETHDAPCCATSDGAIGPLQLPYARVRYVRAGRRPGTMRRFPLAMTPQAGLVAYERVGGDTVTVKLALDAPETVATAAAGAILARAAGGRWEGAQRPLALAFGVLRPVRPMALAHAVTLLGLPVARMMVRTADFRGGRVLPADPLPPSDLLVRGRGRTAQHEWTAIALGRPQLDRCGEIVVERVPAPMLELRCDAS